MTRPAPGPSNCSLRSLWCPAAIATDQSYWDIVGWLIAWVTGPTYLLLQKTALSRPRIHPQRARRTFFFSRHSMARAQFLADDISPLSRQDVQAQTMWFKWTLFSSEPLETLRFGYEGARSQLKVNLSPSLRANLRAPTGHFASLRCLNFAVIQSRIITKECSQGASY